MKRILIFTLITLGSCTASKQTSQVKETIKVDTFTRNVDRYIYKSIHDTLTIENPCDSLRLRDFYYKSNLPQGKVVIRSTRGKIQATIDVDSIVNVYELMYKAKLSSSSNVITKYVRTNIIPQWALLTIIIETLIIGLYIYFRIIFPK